MIDYRFDKESVAVRAQAAKLIADLSKVEGVERKQKEKLAEMQDEVAALDEEVIRLQREETAMRKVGNSTSLVFSSLCFLPVFFFEL